MLEVNDFEMHVKQLLPAQFSKNVESQFNTNVFIR